MGIILTCLRRSGIEAIRNDLTIRQPIKCTTISAIEQADRQIDTNNLRMMSTRSGISWW